MFEGTRSTCDADVMAEMGVAVDKLQRHNQTLEDDIQNIKQHQ